MFHPSRSVLFPALSKLSIHQQAPLNPHESKQLLNLLTHSFRQHLDEEHPYPLAGGIKPSKLELPKLNHQEHPRPRRHSFPDTPKNPTEHHMKAVLTHPLFNQTSSTSVWQSSKDPMDLFEAAVAKGMMTVPYAYACLNAKYRQIMESAIPTARDRLRDSGAGLKVLKWLISSGNTNDLEFLHKSGVTILMKFMVAEGLQEATWSWIQRSIEGLPGLLLLKDGERHRARQKLVRPLSTLIDAECSGSVSLDMGYMALSRAAGYLEGLSLADKRIVLEWPGHILSRLMILDLNSRPKASEAAFMSFFDLIPAFSSMVECRRAHLSLFHPVAPSADLALQYLRQVNEEGCQEGMGSQSQKDSTVVHLGLDTAKLLLNTDKTSEAKWVISFLQAKYPLQVGSSDEKLLRRAEAEATSLELLDALNCA